MHGRKTLYTNRAFNSLQFDVFYGIFERTVDFLRFFFAQLKLSGRVYTLTTVSGLTLSPPSFYSNFELFLYLFLYHMNC